MLLIELNEVNFEFVKSYGKKGHLRTLNRLIETHGLTETTSESQYEHLEPWIQWVTAHTGLSFKEHGVFRLGDINQTDELNQIWEVLEKKGTTVGAISPMNASNECENPAFFVPDPWTKTKVSGPSVLRGLSEAIGQVVNDNAQGRIGTSSYFQLALGIMSYAKRENFPRYFSLLRKLKNKKWSKAMILDQLLADVFCKEVVKTKVEFASLFLNAAAHIQHHYMFNAKVYDGTNRNPEWYISENSDPVFEVYQLYDQIVDQIERSFPNRRLLIATGLHQDPYKKMKYYWRLKNYRQFLELTGVKFDRVEGRMSRDFMIFCESKAEAEQSADKLGKIRTGSGGVLFEIDNRGKNLFVMLTYPHNIEEQTVFYSGNHVFKNLRQHVAFVAIKNGDHNGIGYLIDNKKTHDMAPKTLPLKNVFSLVEENFAEC